MTPKRVTRICTRLGYEITERKMTDWIRKGLMPPLNHKGRGHSKGKLYYWDSPYIVAQLLAAEGLMSWYSRSKYVLLMLWFNGFNINASLVRETWLSVLKGRNQGLIAKYPDPFDWEEKIDRLMLRDIRALDTSEKAIMKVLKFIAKIIWSNEFDLVNQLSEENPEVLDAQMFGRREAGENDTSNSGLLVNGLVFLKKHFSPDAKIKLLESASNEELMQAQEDWSIVLRFFESLLRASQPGDSYAWPDVRWAQFWWRIITHIGGTAILLNLALRKEGFTSKIEHSVSLVKNNTDQAALTREIRCNVATGRLSRRGRVLLYKFTSALVNIWTDSDRN